MRVVGRVEDEATLATGCPAGAADGPGPVAAHTQVRIAFLDGDRMPSARATIAIRIVPGGVVVPMSGGARGVLCEPVVGVLDPPPRQRVAVAVADAALEGEAGRRPGLSRLASSLWVGHGAGGKGGCADQTGSDMFSLEWGFSPKPM